MQWIKASERVPDLLPAVEYSVELPMKYEGCDYTIGRYWKTKDEEFIHSTHGHHINCNYFHLVEWLDESAPDELTALRDESKENEFALWIVSNRFQYKVENHTWYTDYIGEMKGKSFKFKELKELFNSLNH